MKNLQILLFKIWKIPLNTTTELPMLVLVYLLYILFRRTMEKKDFLMR